MRLHFVSPPSTRYLGRSVGPEPLNAYGAARGAVPHCAPGCQLFAGGVYDHHGDCPYVAWVCRKADEVRGASVGAVS